MRISNFIAESVAWRGLHNVCASMGGRVAGQHDAGDFEMLHASNFVEPIPVETLFIDAMDTITRAADGLLYIPLGTLEDGGAVLRIRLLVPIARAVEMNNRAAALLMNEYRRFYSLKIVS